MRNKYLFDAYRDDDKKEEGKLGADGGVLTMLHLVASWGLDPNNILSRNALVRPHRTELQEQDQIEILNQSLKQAIIQELQQTTQSASYIDARVYVL